MQNDAPMYAPVAPKQLVFEDEGYEIGTVEQAKQQEVEAPQEKFERTRREVIVALAEVMYKAESGKLVMPAFDKSDPSHQRHIRMAEAVFAWVTKR